MAKELTEVRVSPNGRQSVSKCNALLERKEAGRSDEPDHERGFRSQQFAKNIMESLVFRVTR